MSLASQIHEQRVRLDFDGDIVASILAKYGRDVQSGTPLRPPLTFGELYSKLDLTESELIDRLLDIDPRQFGMYGKFITYNGPLDNLVPIDGQTYERDGHMTTINTRHVPAPLWRAFQGMQTAMRQDIGTLIMIESGYRSPAHQALTFLTYLHREHGNIRQVAERVTFPGYSQHGDPVCTAIDVIDQFGMPTDDEPQRFAETEAYAWMTDHAAEYGFYMTYPEDNPDGVMFEPWHWRYMPE